MNDKILVTSALPYVNNVPHLGTMVCILSADVYARFMKSSGYDVVSVLGTDEHGTTTEVKAIEEGLTPRQLVDKYYAVHKRIYEWFNTAFDCFGRTSAQENVEVSQDIFKRLHANGYIIAQTVTQMWDTKAEKFLADRFITGTCPHCGYAEAKGDQCEECGRLLSPEELQTPKSQLTGTTPIPKDTEHLFIDLKKIEPKLLKWIEQHEATWSANARTTTRAWLKEGLRPRCITRDLKWGIPVPLEGYENKVFYSWFDAPIGYISIAKGCRQDWQDWWKDPEGTRLVQFMGKDNIPFHTILFPAFCIGADDNYTLMDTISVNEYLNYESGKFSKSRGEGVFCDDAMDSGIPADVWRYYIMNNRPEREDTLFAWDDFQEKNNKELLANLGNFINRTISFLNRFFDSKVPQMTDHELIFAYGDAKELMERIEQRKALKTIMSFARSANQYFQEKEPWNLVKQGKGGNEMANLVLAVADLAVLIEPFMPETSKAIFDQLQLKPRGWADLGAEIPAGHAVGEAKPLFRKLEDQEIEAFRKKFTGKTQFCLDLRIARIDSVEPHPHADKLYIEHIDLGDERRTIVSGLAGHYDPDELIGKDVVVVANLKPAKLRGVESQGMLLAVGDEDVGLLLAPEGKPGEHIKGCKGKEMITIEQFAAVDLKAQGGKVLLDGKEVVTESGAGIHVDKGKEGPVR